MLKKERYIELSQQEVKICTTEAKRHLQKISQDNCNQYCYRNIRGINNYFDTYIYGLGREWINYL